MNIKVLAFLIMVMSSCGASAAIVPLTRDVCIRYADMTETVKAKGFMLVATGSLADGRKLEEYYNSSTGDWIPVVIWIRPATMNLSSQRFLQAGMTSHRPTATSL